LQVLLKNQKCAPCDYLCEINFEVLERQGGLIKITPSFHHFITPSLHHPITSSPHHFITPSLHHPITSSPHHFIIPSLHRSITLLLSLYLA